MIEECPRIIPVKFGENANSQFGGDACINWTGMKRVLRKSTRVSTEYWLFWKYSIKYWVHIL